MRLICLALIALPLAAQDSASRTIVPLPAIFYTPETGLALGAAVGLFSTLPRRADGTQPPTSSGLGVGIFTTKSQLLLSFKAELWPNDGRERVLANVDFQRFPTKYWGLGNASPDSLEEDYTPQFAAGLFEFNWRFWRSLYAGFVVRARWRTIRESTADGLVDSWSRTSRALGTGSQFTWDTRDKVAGPTRGTLLQLRSEQYLAPLTTGGGWSTTTLDLRAYLPLMALGPRHALATQFTVRTAAGAPFDQMPALGGDALLRGFYEGRYRDRALWAAQAEYRGYFAGPVGLALGAGVGRVAPRLGDLSLSDLHVAVGGGLRVMIDAAAGLALRADWATSTDGRSSGFYVSAGEAF